MTVSAVSEVNESGPVVALAGGVGAARMLSGLVQVVPPEDVVAIVNTGDDRVFYDVHVCPDLDIVTYTLGDVVNRKLGFGLEGDSFNIVERLAKLGHEVWFRLGDRDYANCLDRSLKLRSGVGLAQITEDLRRSYGVSTRLLPMSEDPCPTMVVREGDVSVHFEEYLIRDGSPDDVKGVDLSAAENAKPAPGVLEAIASARVIVVCPSNPVVSIGPILALPAIREALAACAAPVVGVSPIVGDAPVKGPADRLLRGIGVEVSARGVAEHYQELLDAFVIDAQDEAQVAAVEALGLACSAVDSMMVSQDVAAALARSVLELAESVR